MEVGTPLKLRIAYLSNKEPHLSVCEYIKVGSCLVFMNLTISHSYKPD